MVDMAQYLAIAIRQAEGGVDYSPRDGATCPFCGARLPVRDTKPWDGPCRVRYHRCSRARCYLAQLETPIKSVEELS